MAEEGATVIDSIGVGLVLDTSAFDRSLSAAQSKLTAFEGSRTRALKAPQAVAMTPSFGVTRAHVRAMKVDINDHFTKMAANGEAIAVPVKLGNSDWSAMRTQIAEKIGTVPIKVSISSAGGGASGGGSGISPLPANVMRRIESTFGQTLVPGSYRPGSGAQHQMSTTTLSNIIAAWIAGTQRIGITNAKQQMKRMASEHGISGYAGGGRVVPNRTILVGEEGPEFFTPQQPGRIIPIRRPMASHGEPLRDDRIRQRIAYQQRVYDQERLRSQLDSGMSEMDIDFRRFGGPAAQGGGAKRGGLPRGYRMEFWGRNGEPGLNKWQGNKISGWNPQYDSAGWGSLPSHITNFQRISRPVMPPSGSSNWPGSFFAVVRDRNGSIVGTTPFDTSQHGGKNFIQPRAVFVSEQHRGKGLATAMLVKSQRWSGAKLIRDTFETPDGYGLFSNPRTEAALRGYGSPRYPSPVPEVIDPATGRPILNLSTNSRWTDSPIGNARARGGFARGVPTQATLARAKGMSAMSGRPVGRDDESHYTGGDNQGLRDLGAGLNGGQPGMPGVIRMTVWLAHPNGEYEEHHGAYTEEGWRLFHAEQAAAGVSVSTKPPPRRSGMVPRGRAFGGTALGGRRSVPVQQGGMPPALGSTPLRDGYVRAFHATRASQAGDAQENLRSILQHGFKISSGRGHEYGEPDAMWFAGQVKGYGDYNEKYAVEAHLPAFWFESRRAGDRRWRPSTIGGPESNMAVSGDISRRRIVSWNEPWMQRYHQMRAEIGQTGGNYHPEPWTASGLIREHGSMYRRYRDLHEQMGERYEDPAKAWDQFVAQAWWDRKAARARRAFGGPAMAGKVTPEQTKAMHLAKYASVLKEWEGGILAHAKTISPELVRSAAQWYPIAHAQALGDLADFGRLDLGDTGVGAFAAASPGMFWPANRALVRMLMGIPRGGEFPRGSFLHDVPGMGETRVSVPYSYEPWSRALEILRTGSLGRLSGPKTVPFHKNLTGIDPEAWTLDARQARIASKNAITSAPGAGSWQRNVLEAAHENAYPHLQDMWGISHRMQAQSILWSGYGRGEDIGSDFERTPSGIIIPRHPGILVPYIGQPRAFGGPAWRGLTGVKQAWEDTLANEGGTFDAYGAEGQPGRGWSVGIPKAGRTAQIVTGHADDLETKKAFIRAYYRTRRVAREQGSPYVGTWVNDKTGNIEIDPAVVLPSRRLADTVARRYGQTGIYGLRHAANPQGVPSRFGYHDTRGTLIPKKPKNDDEPRHWLHTASEARIQEIIEQNSPASVRGHERVPIESLMGFRDFDREVTKKSGPGATDLDALTEDIRQHGFHRPLAFQYFQKQGKAFLADGNHRLAAARRLGLKTVPVFARVSNATYRLRRGMPFSGPTDIPLDRSSRYPNEEYADVLPSDIGLRAFGGPAFNGLDRHFDARNGWEPSALIDMREHRRWPEIVRTAREMYGLMPRAMSAVSIGFQDDDYESGNRDGAAAHWSPRDWQINLSPGILDRYSGPQLRDTIIHEAGHVLESYLHERGRSHAVNEFNRLGVMGAPISRYATTRVEDVFNSLADRDQILKYGGVGKLQHLMKIAMRSGMAENFATSFEALGTGSATPVSGRGWEESTWRERMNNGGLWTPEGPAASVLGKMIDKGMVSQSLIDALVDQYRRGVGLEPFTQSPNLPTATHAFMNEIFESMFGAHTYGPEGRTAYGNWNDSKSANGWEDRSRELRRGMAHLIHSNADVLRYRAFGGPATLGLQDVYGNHKLLESGRVHLVPAQALHDLYMEPRFRTLLRAGGSGFDREYLEEIARSMMASGQEAPVDARFNLDRTPSRAVWDGNHRIGAALLHPDALSHLWTTFSDGPMWDPMSSLPRDMRRSGGGEVWRRLLSAGVLATRHAGNRARAYYRRRYEGFDENGLMAQYGPGQDAFNRLVQAAGAEEDAKWNQFGPDTDYKFRRKSGFNTNFASRANLHEALGSLMPIEPMMSVRALLRRMVKASPDDRWEDRDVEAAFPRTAPDRVRQFERVQRRRGPISPKAAMSIIERDFKSAGREGHVSDWTAIDDALDRLPKTNAWPPDTRPWGKPFHGATGGPKDLDYFKGQYTTGYNPVRMRDVHGDVTGGTYPGKNAGLDRMTYRDFYDPTQTTEAGYRTIRLALDPDRRNAKGGRERGAQTYLVGELNPELFIPNRLRHIIPPTVMDKIPKRSEGGETRRLGPSGVLEVGTKGPHLFTPPEDGWIVPHNLVAQVTPNIPRAAGGRRPKLPGRDQISPDLIAALRTEMSEYPEMLAESMVGSLKEVAGSNPRVMLGNIFASGSRRDLMQRQLRVKFEQRQMQQANVAAIPDIAYGKMVAASPEFAQAKARVAAREFDLAQARGRQVFGSVMGATPRQQAALDKSVKFHEGRLDAASKALEPFTNAISSAAKAQRGVADRAVALGKIMKDAEPTLTDKLSTGLGTFTGFAAYNAAQTTVSVAMAAATPQVEKWVDSILGFTAANQKVTKGIGDSLRQNGGNLQTTMGQLALSSGLSGGAMGFLGRALGSASYAKAGASAQGEKSEQFKASANNGAPSGLIGGYGGLFGSGFLGELMGGGKGYAEQIGLDVKDFFGKSKPGETVTGANGQAFPSSGYGSADYFTGLIPSFKQMVVAGGGSVTQNARTPEQQASLDALNAYTEDTASAMQRGAKAMGQSADGFVEITDAMVSSGAVEKFKALGSEAADMVAGNRVLVDENGKVITDVKKYKEALAQGVRGNAIGTPEAFASQQAQGLRAQFQTNAAQAEHARDISIPQQLGQQLASQPFLAAQTGVYTAGGGDLLGGSSGQVGRLLGDAKRTQDELTTAGQKAISTMTDWIAGLDTGDGVMVDASKQYSGLMASVTASGKKIAEYQTQIADAQLGAAEKSYRNNLRLANRAVSDALGLAGRAGGAGNLGAVQREQTMLGFQLQQRQINFSVAQAGFQAPGLTSEQRAANIAQAKYEAKIQQRQLNLSKTAFGIEAGRGVTDTQASRSVMKAEWEAERVVAAANKAMAAEQLKMGQQLNKANTIVQHAEGNFGSVLSSASSYVATFGDYVKTATTTIATSLGMKDPYAPKAHTGGKATGVVHTAHTATTMTYGEAGAETAVVIRNPRNLLDGSAMGKGGYTPAPAGPTVVNVTVQGDVKDEATVAKMVRAVEDALNRKGARLGMRSFASGQR